MVGADLTQDYRTLRDKDLEWGSTATTCATSCRPTGPTNCRLGADGGSTSATLCSTRFSAAGPSQGSRVQERSALPAHQRTANTQPAGFGCDPEWHHGRGTAEESHARPGANGNIFFDEDLIGPDGRANTVPQLSHDAGQQGQYVYLYGPGLWVADLGVNKSFRLGAARVHFEALLINAFNHRNPIVGGTGGATLSIDSTTFGRRRVTPSAAIGSSGSASTGSCRPGL